MSKNIKEKILELEKQLDELRKLEHPFCIRVYLNNHTIGSFWEKSYGDQPTKTYIHQCALKHLPYDLKPDTYMIERAGCGDTSNYYSIYYTC